MKQRKLFFLVKDRQIGKSGIVNLHAVVLLVNAG
jgi:hypothetical protein